MAKMIDKYYTNDVEKKHTIEKWLLDNGLEITLFPGETESTFGVDAESGDVTEAILEKLKKDEKYASLELIYSLSPQIECASNLVKDIFDDIEKMDIASLGKGKSY